MHDQNGPSLAEGAGGRVIAREIGSQERDVVFNVVWTGRAFEYLAPFVASQLTHTGARFRFVANACPADQVRSMERFASDHPDRVVEVLEVSADRMVRHGDALDVVLRSRHDGPYFAFIDPDILVRGPFLTRFVDLLTDHAAVTSGRELWSDDNIRPADHIGVNGEYFFDQDGFVFGSPHLALYCRDTLDEVIARWNVGFSSAGGEVDSEVRDQLRTMGRDYWIFDTAKIVNILLQADGLTLCHEEHHSLLHIGGVSHYLAPPSSVRPAGELSPWWEGADWGTWDGMAARYQVARYTASVLLEGRAGRPAPPLPPETPAHLVGRLEVVRDAVAALDLGEASAPPQVAR